jgi:hypothetical protein
MSHVEKEASHTGVERKRADYTTHDSKGGDMKRRKEEELYPKVARWLKRKYRCFATGVNTGLRYSRPDVIGVRDVGGDLSGEVESIIVEVKRGTQPFATASGQALGYKVYANRVYLADFRTDPFSPEETHIASHLGIGLIQITRSRCMERLSSPYYDPIPRLNLALLENMALGHCQLCGSLFRIGEGRRRYANVTRENLRQALVKEKGFMFWNREVAERKERLGVRSTGDDTTYERRYLCPDCVWSVLSQLSPFESEHT